MIKEAVFDLDHTLIDTSIVIAALRNACADRGIIYERFDEAHDRSCGYSPSGVRFYAPSRHAEELAADGRHSAAELEETLYRTLTDAVPHATFPGAATLLERLRHDGWKLTLLTLGQDRWQRAKLSASGLAAFFTDIHATEEDKPPVLARIGAATGCVVINDNPEEVLAMRSMCPELRYILKRGPKGVPEEWNLPIADTMEDIGRLMLS